MLDPTDKKKINELFSDWLEIKEQRKGLTASNKEIIEEAAMILDTKSQRVNKLFSFLEKKMEDGIDELDEINELAAQVET